MIFNSFVFLFLFLPIVFSLFVWKPMRPHRLALLIASSLIFYLYAGFLHAAILVAEAILVVSLMRNIETATWPQLRFWIATIVPLLILCYFKYAGFLASNIFFVLGDDSRLSSFSLLSNIILPAGISFFTFELVSYCIDRRNGLIPNDPPFAHTVLFVTFFPHLVAGPILRFEQMKEPIAKLRSFMPNRADISSSICYICSGLAAKVLLADSLGSNIADLIHDGPGSVTRLGAIYVVSAYSFQIYFDFYGYSLVAIGLARLFGFTLPDNFLRPYEARNPRDFWRRWHVTLSLWLRDYVYFKLGGNQAYTRNILIVFAACGLWHGAGWNFVIWGLYHAVLILGYTASRKAWDSLPALLQVTLNFTLVSFGWLLFLFNLSDAGKLMSALLGGQGYSDPSAIKSWITLGLAAVVCFCARPEKWAHAQAISRLQIGLFTVAMAALALAILINIDTSRDFIYFRF